MTKLTTLSTLIAAAGLSLSAAVFLSTPAKAVGSMLEKCGPQSSRALVERCCETWIKREGVPLWMYEANLSSCGSVVSCSPRRRGVVAIAYVPKCRIQIPLNDNQGSANNPGRRRQPGLK